MLISITRHILWVFHIYTLPYSSVSIIRHILWVFHIYTLPYSSVSIIIHILWVFHIYTLPYSSVRTKWSTISDSLVCKTKIIIFPTNFICIFCEHCQIISAILTSTSLKLQSCWTYVLVIWKSRSMSLFLSQLLNHMLPWIQKSLHLYYNIHKTDRRTDDNNTPLAIFGRG